MIRSFYRAEVYRTAPDDRGLAWIVLLESPRSSVTIAACSTEAEAEYAAAIVNGLGQTDVAVVAGR